MNEKDKDYFDIEYDIGEEVEIDGLESYVTKLRGIYIDSNGISYYVKWTDDQGRIDSRYFSNDEITPL
jgi:hypothetical protein